MGRRLRNRYVWVGGLLALLVTGWNLYVAAHAGGLVEGRVVGPDGRPVSGASVTLRERTLTHLEPRAEVRTEVDGAFRFVGHRGHHIVLEAAKDGVGTSGRVPYRLWFRGQDLILGAPLRLDVPG